MTGYHTRWVRPPEQAEDPERIAIREALAFGKAVYDQRRAASGWSLPRSRVRNDAGDSRRSGAEPAYPAWQVGGSGGEADSGQT
jgi:hypothetical protein